MHYRQIYERYLDCCLLPGVEIHHKDGNRQNNSIDNLRAVTIEEHFNIHLDQGDYFAASLILSRMNGKKNHPELISRGQRKLLAENRHNFQKIEKERRAKIGQYAGKKTKDAEVGIHAINKDPLRHFAVASSGGKTALASKKGFFDPNKHGAQFTRGTKWWTNILTGERKRLPDSPGKDWKEGMKCK